MTDTTFTPNNLGEALSVRYPSVWVHALDSVEVIEYIRSSVRSYDDLSFYLFHSLDGLQRFNYRTNRFDTVLTEVMDPMTGEMVQIGISKFGDVISLLYTDIGATLLVLNAEQFEDDLNDLHAFMHFGWRNSWQNDNSESVPFQIVFTSTVQPGPPPQASSFVPVIQMGFPSKSEFSDMVFHISSKTEVEVDLEKVADASRGLSKFEAISLYHSQIARHGTIDIKELETIKFEKIAARTSLQVIRPKVTLDDVAGAENIKKILQTSLWMKENPALVERYGFDSSMHRFMLLGLPGVGKSYFCEAAANELNLNLVRTGLSHMMSKFVGESENNIRAMFEQIAALDPICVWADEFGRDASGGQSSHIVDAGTTTRMHGLFLTGLQELSDSTYFFAAANDISTLAPEMLRADRFDKIFFVGFPTAEHRHQILSNLLANKEHSVSIEKIAEATASYTGAELKSALTAAGSKALSERRAIQTSDVVECLNRMKDRLWIRYRSNVMDQYRQAENQYEWASDDQYAEAKSYIEGRPPRKSLSGPEITPVITNAAFS